VIVGLKLRALVTHTATPAGAVLRLDERTLVLRGARAYASFLRVADHLDGRWTRQQLCASASTEAQPTLSKLLDALIDAGMVYSVDVADEDIRTVSVRAAPRAASYIARIESTCAHPVTAFRAALAREVHVCGSPWMANALIEACHEVGLTRVRASTDAPDRGALVIVTGDATVRRIPLVVCGATVLVGPFAKPGRAGCAACLVASYETATAGAPDTGRLAAAVGLAARILLQRWLDLDSGAVVDDDAALVSAIDVDTLETTRHPLPPRPGCLRCGAAFALHPTPPATRVDREAGPTIDDVLPRAHKYLTDPATGLFDSIGEGSLLQLPHKQSMVEWRDPYDRSRRWWTTEAADDVRSARLAAVRTALEQYLLDAMASSATSSSANPPALVVCAQTTEELHARSALSALLLIAQDHGEWRTTAIHPARLDDRAAQTLAYLEDVGEATRIVVDRAEALSRGGCHVLRFTYDDTVVTIAAGESESQLWARGLQDIWLHITAAMDGPPRAVRRPVMRLRPVIAPHSADDVAERASALADRLGLRVAVTPLTAPVLEWVRPLVFASVSVDLTAPGALVAQQAVDAS
jgi:bacteriocin biosynthesis cyclodehydratase domain-containing protein